jgi:hypothetical protein
MKLFNIILLIFILGCSSKVEHKQYNLSVDTISYDSAFNVYGAEFEKHMVPNEVKYVLNEVDEIEFKDGLYYCIFTGRYSYGCEFIVKDNDSLIVFTKLVRY